MPNLLKGRTFIRGKAQPGDTYSRGLNVSKNTVAYTDTAAKTLFTLPANADIVGITVDVITAFDDSGTDVLDIGTSGSANRYKNDLSVATTGQTATGWSNLGDVGSSGVIITATYAGQTGDATNGQASVTFLWYRD